MTKSDVGPTQKMLNIWAVVLILWSFYRATFKMALPIWFDEFIAKPAVFLLPIYWFIVKVEKKPFLKGLGFPKTNKIMDIVFGLGIGCFFIATAFLTRMVKGLPFPAFSLTSTSLIWILSTIVAASME
ncbi:MAG: hypothetical protein NTZ55_03130, partial [Candidatus Roizmanbacteria bacterium]|nr:hypothetical protein [Candidatus Roizmanbacteria bacterium]